MPAQVPEKARQIMPSIPKSYPRSYADCERMSKRKSSKLGHNTHLCPGIDEKGQAFYAVRLYGTNVVTFYPDGRVILDTGDWNTPTTRLRFRACGFNFSRKDVDSWPGTRVQFQASDYPDGAGFDVLTEQDAYDAAWASFLESLEPV